MEILFDLNNLVIDKILILVQSNVIKSWYYINISDNIILQFSK